MNGTLQGRLVNELRVAGITTIAAANRYLRERFLPDFNAEFHRAPTDPTPAFVPLGTVDLDQILCHQAERTVGRDNVVTLEGVALQLAKQPGRRTCAGLRVLVRRHLDGRHSLWLGSRRLGLYDGHGRPISGDTQRAAPHAIVAPEATGPARVRPRPRAQAAPASCALA